MFRKIKRELFSSIEKSINDMMNESQSAMQTFGDAFSRSASTPPPLPGRRSPGPPPLPNSKRPGCEDEDDEYENEDWEEDDEDEEDDEYENEDWEEDDEDEEDDEYENEDWEEDDEDEIPVPASKNKHRKPKIAAEPETATVPAAESTSHGAVLSEKIQYLIEMALADGVVTEAELQVLVRKGTEEGIDPDEMVMIVNAMMHKRKTADMEVKRTEMEREQRRAKRDAEAKAAKSARDKCPKCGAMRRPGQRVCDECGAPLPRVTIAPPPLPGAKAPRSETHSAPEEPVYIFMQEINEIEQRIRKRKSERRAGIFDDFIEEFKGRATDPVVHRYTVELVDRINEYLVPSSREGLIELVTQGAPKCKDDISVDIRNAWEDKLSQAIGKARALYGDDKKLMRLMDRYEDSLDLEL